jgi:hypothetical protein
MVKLRIYKAPKNHAEKARILTLAVEMNDWCGLGGEALMKLFPLQGTLLLVAVYLHYPKTYL